MRDIKNYEGLYAITEDGRVWSYKSKKFLKPIIQENGYIRVELYNNKKRKFYLVHRLVAQTYISNPNNLSEVNHKDEDKTNNHLSNLEWCSHSYNNTYGTRQQRATAKIRTTAKPVHCVELNKVFASATEAARVLCLKTWCISRCCKGQLKTTGGYHWQYT